MPTEVIELFNESSQRNESGELFTEEYKVSGPTSSRDARLASGVPQFGDRYGSTDMFLVDSIAEPFGGANK